MACNPCCCFSLKDSAVMIGIWTLIFSIAQLGIMGWQMAAIKYEKDRAANTLLPNYNTYGKYDIPSYYESYWQSPEERYYTGLFVIQILCLIAAFFLLFSSVALIYGVHTWSRHLIWPWFICIVSSILSSLAYCIMWWAGDVRDYWMALTILEIIAVFINVYCVVVIYMFMQRLATTTDEYEGKHPQVRYKINRNGYTRKDLDDYRAYESHRRTPEQIMKSPYPHYTTPLREPYPQRRPMGTPQISPSTQAPQGPSIPPYPVDTSERIQYDQEPKARFVEKDDSVAHWVKDQQRIALLSERAEANSEPVSPSRYAGQEFSLQHSRSVPSLYDGTLVSHRSCRHGKHRSSSRRRSRSRYVHNSSDSESPIEFSHEQRRRRRSRSRTHYIDSDVTETSDRYNRDDQTRRRMRSSSGRHKKERGDRRALRERDGDRRRHEKDSHERDRRQDKEDITIERGSRQRQGRESGVAERVPERMEKDVTVDSVPGEAVFPLAGGISIPQHIVIPPSMGERGPDGTPLPQKFQINSEITINYDGHRPSSISDLHESYRRYPAVGIQSNV